MFFPILAGVFPTSGVPFSTQATTIWLLDSSGFKHMVRNQIHALTCNLESRSYLKLPGQSFTWSPSKGSPGWPAWRHPMHGEGDHPPGAQTVHHLLVPALAGLQTICEASRERLGQRGAWSLSTDNLCSPCCKPPPKKTGALFFSLAGVLSRRVQKRGGLMFEQGAMRCLAHGLVPVQAVLVLFLLRGRWAAGLPNDTSRHPRFNMPIFDRPRGSCKAFPVHSPRASIAQAPPMLSC